MKKTLTSRDIVSWSFVCSLLTLVLPHQAAAQFGPDPGPDPFPDLKMGGAISIISPANRSMFYVPADLPIYAYARDCLGPVAGVHFFAGTNDLGPAQRLPISTPPYAIPSYRFSRDQFSLVWSNPPIGDYALSAVATNLFRGHAATSAPVYISIRAAAPPATNQVGIVSVVATDPVAIAGTNCWSWRGPTNGLPSWTNRPAWGWFTNCGPKDAAFAVRRFGDCSHPLSVAYQTTGTATNGVQYAALPGWVTIPAGQSYALIPVVPIDDGKPDINRTVILTLTPPSLPATYTLGFPRSAAALIHDSYTLKPPTGMLPGGSFHLSADGPDGAWFHVEYSTGLGNWTPLCTNQVVNGAIDFVDPDAAANPARFYRAVPELSPPVR